MAFTEALDWARTSVDSGLLPTAVLGIADRDTVHELAAFGPTTVDASYALFSITKPVVALAAMREVEAGRLTLDAPLADFVPGFGSRHRTPITLHHLLTHTSGLNDPVLHAPLRPSLLAAESLFRAGTMSRYSSIAFEGIAAMVEGASGRPWQQCVAEVASGLSFDGEGSLPVLGAADAGLDHSAMQALRHPGAGLHGRAADLLALGQRLLRDEVVHPSTLVDMLTPRTLGLPRLEPYPIEAGQDWGLGFNLRYAAPGLRERNVYGHGGWSCCEFWVLPGRGITFVLLTNTAPPATWALAADGLHNAVVAGLGRAGSPAGSRAG